MLIAQSNIFSTSHLANFHLPLSVYRFRFGIIFDMSELMSINDKKVFFVYYYCIDIVKFIKSFIRALSLLRFETNREWLTVQNIAIQSLYCHCCLVIISHGYKSEPFTLISLVVFNYFNRDNSTIWTK